MLLLLGSVNHTMAQKHACPMPDDGYWQIVTNIHDPAVVTVRFYDLEAHLIYQENMTVIPDWRRRKTCRWLNESLRSALIAWQRARHPELKISAAFI